MNEVEIATTCPTCGQPVTVTIDVDPWINTWANVVLTGTDAAAPVICEELTAVGRWGLPGQCHGASRQIDRLGPGHGQAEPLIDQGPGWHWECRRQREHLTSQDKVASGERDRVIDQCDRRLPGEGHRP